MGKAFDIEPRAVASVNTGFRRIVTKIPHPQSVEVCRPCNASNRSR